MNNKKNKRGFTLAELILSIAILAVFSMVIIQIFAQAQEVTVRAEVLDRAVVCVTDWVDQWKSDDLTKMDPVVERLWQQEQSETVTTFLDLSFRECSPDLALYRAELTSRKEDGTNFFTLTAAVFLLTGQDSIYQVTAGKWRPGG